MLRVSCGFDSTQHHLIHPPFEQWIKERVPDETLRDSLFVYHHTLRGTFVIGMWVSPGRFVDLMNLGDSLANFNRERARILEQQLLRPLSDRELSEGFKRAERDRLSLMQENNDQRKEDLAWRRSTTTKVSFAEV